MRKSSFVQDNAIISRVNDAVKLSQKYSSPYYIGFFDEHQTAIAKSFLKKIPIGFSFWGGFDSAQRVYLALSPKTFPESELKFPIVALELKYPTVYQLSHRDFLGSFLALGLKREKIGDILVEDGRCIAFVSEDVSTYILSQITKVGKVGVSVSKCTELVLPTQRGFKDISGTVASPRLDCIVGLLCSTSRNSALQLIKSGDVCVDFIQIQNATKKIANGQTISIRRHGRYIIDEIGDLTKKGRCIVKSKKYL